MAKYKINREFFPFSHFTPPISERFLRMAVPNMKTPKYIYKDKELDVSRHEIKSYDGVKIECFLMSPKSVKDNTFTAVDLCWRRQAIITKRYEICKRGRL